MARGLLVASLLALLAVALVRAGAERAGAPQAQAESPPLVTLRTVIVGSCQELQRYAESLVGARAIRSAAERAASELESVLGQENVHALAAVSQTAVRFLAEGAASGLNVIAVYVTEILRVTGFDVALKLPRFTPEGVITMTQWALLGLFAKLVLSTVLRLLLCVFRQVFWVVRTVLALWLFGLIVMDQHASAETTAVRVGVLVLVYVLLSHFGSGETAAVEKRLHRLESQLSAMERKRAE